MRASEHTNWPCFGARLVYICLTGKHFDGDTECKMIINRPPRTGECEGDNYERIYSYLSMSTRFSPCSLHVLNMCSGTGAIIVHVTSSIKTRVYEFRYITENGATYILIREYEEHMFSPCPIHMLNVCRGTGAIILHDISSIKTRVYEFKYTTENGASMYQYIYLYTYI